MMPVNSGAELGSFLGQTTKSTNGHQVDCCVDRLKFICLEHFWTRLDLLAPKSAVLPGGAQG